MNPEIIGCIIDGIFCACVECGYDNQSIKCMGLIDENEGEYIYGDD